jgi:hypothetical protein
MSAVEYLLTDRPGILGDTYFYLSEAYRKNNEDRYADFWMRKFLEILYNRAWIPSDIMTHAAIYSHCKKYYPKLLEELPPLDVSMPFVGATCKWHLDSMFTSSMLTFTSKYLK